jgi:hypothetical protein
LSDGVELFWEYQERYLSEAVLVNIVRGGQRAATLTALIAGAAVLGGYSLECTINAAT